MKQMNQFTLKLFFISFLILITQCSLDNQMNYPTGVPKEASFDRKKNVFVLRKDKHEYIWYDNGKLYSDCELNEIGIRNGKCEFFSEFNGNLLSKGNYVNNLRDGLWHWYFPNGNIYYKQNFSHKFKRDFWVETNLIGNEHGPYERYYSNGQLEEKGEYDQGFKSGKWEKFYPSGKLEYTGAYEKDNKIGSWKFYFPNGNLEAEENFSNKAEFLSRITYFPNGNVNCKNVLNQPLDCK